MPRISQLPAKTTPASGDEIAIVEVATSTTKKITRADLLKGADLPNDTVTTGAIKNGAVTTNKIAEKAVTANKIDFTTYGTVDSNGWADYGTHWKKSIISTSAITISPRTALFVNFGTEFGLPVGVSAVNGSKVTLTDTLVTNGFNSHSTIGNPADAFGMFYTNVHVDNSNYGTRRITAVYYK